LGHDLGYNLVSLVPWAVGLLVLGRQLLFGRELLCIVADEGVSNWPGLTVVGDGELQVTETDTLVGGRRGAC
jgi:hypothetical protein